MALVWCHGGSFGAGCVTWDEELRATLSAAGLQVHAVDFVLDDFERAVGEVKRAVQQHQAVAVGGCSSGAFLAHVVAQDCGLPALLVAPVTQPYRRHPHLAPPYQDLQLKSFHTLERLRQWEERVPVPNAPRVIVAGALDAVRARVDGFLAPWLRGGSRLYVRLVPLDHAGTCATLPSDAVETLLRWL